VGSIARWIVGALIAALFLCTTPYLADSKSGPDNIDPALLADAKANPNSLFNVIVRGAPVSTGNPTRTADDNRDRVLKAEDVLSSTTTRDGARRTLSIVGGASGALRGSQIIALSRMPRVDRIVRDQTFQVSWDESDSTASATEAGILAVNAPQAWSAGAKGDGVTVAVIDSGVADHPDLAGRILTRVDFTGEQSNGDPGGHGTHVAGLIAGNGASSNGAWTGVAPDANIVSVRVIDATGHAKLSWIFAGMQWVLANRNTYHIKVVNMSFGGTALTGYQNDLLASAAEMLNFAGLTVVVSAGNAGPGQSTITTPADDPFVITVGAADDNGTATLGDDRVASWSSQGPTAFDGIAKPDVVAPGRKMIGLRAAGSAIDTAYPERRVTAPGSTTARYFTMSGTSMAAPVVAGAAALFLERYPWSSPPSREAAAHRNGAPAGRRIRHGPGQRGDRRICRDHDASAVGRIHAVPGEHRVRGAGLREAVRAADRVAGSVIQRRRGFARPAVDRHHLGRHHLGWHHLGGHHLGGIQLAGRDLGGHHMGRHQLGDHDRATRR